MNTDLKSTPSPADEIAALDNTALSFLREAWIDAKTEDKPKWMERINKMLDERLRLMRLRDAAIV